jgi:hypothetical protein
MVHWLTNVMVRKSGVDTKLVRDAIQKLGKGKVDGMTYAIERMLDEVEEKGIEKGDLAKTIKVFRNTMKKGQSLSMQAELMEISQEEMEYLVRAIQENRELSDIELAIRLQDEKQSA